jgi:hypothetical protein
MRCNMKAWFDGKNPAGGTGPRSTERLIADSRGFTVLSRTREDRGRRERAVEVVSL